MTTDDAIKIVEETHPEKAVLTHLGMQMLFRGPEKEAKLIREKTGVATVAAVDGMRITFGETINIGMRNKKDQQGLDMFL
jgi:phosphoribosyl 1,2-cyclic phosphodiesterase